MIYDGKTSTMENTNTSEENSCGTSSYEELSNYLETFKESSDPESTKIVHN